MLQQINLNSPHHDLKLSSSSKYYSASGESVANSATTVSSCSFDASANSDASSPTTLSTRGAKVGKPPSGNKRSKEDKTRARSAHAKRDSASFRFEVDSEESLTSTLLGSACAKGSSRKRDEASDEAECASTGKTTASFNSAQSSLNISASAQVGTKGDEEASAESKPKSSAVAGGSVSSKLQERRPPPGKYVDRDQVVSLLEGKLERQSRLLKAALARQVELKQEAQHYYTSKKQHQQQLEDVSRKYSLLKQEYTKMKEENVTLVSELKKSKDIGREILEARRSARSALSDMATQNAKLTAMLVERKQEMRKMKAELDAFRKVKTGVADASEERLKAYETEIEELREKLALEQKRQDSGHSGANANANSNASQSSEEFNLSTSSKDSQRSEASTQSECAHFELAPSRPTRSQQSEEVSSAACRSNGSDHVHGKDTPKTVRIRAMEKENGALKSENTKLRGMADQLQRHEQKLEMRTRVERCKQAGNNAYNSGKYKDAHQEYTKALSLKIDDVPLKAVLYCNRSAALIKVCHFIDAIADSTKAITLDKDYNRAYQRRSEAYEKIGDYGNAAKDLETYIKQMGGYDKVPSDLRRHFATLQRRATASSSTLNPYAVLGLAASCSSSEVRSSYRSFALRYHPDKNTDELVKSVSEGLFKIISEAYSTLSDTDKRRKHDYHSQRRRTAFF